LYVYIYIHTYTLIFIYLLFSRFKNHPMKRGRGRREESRWTVMSLTAALALMDPIGEGGGAA
jgi:hypothetical protein